MCRNLASSVSNPSAKNWELNKIAVHSQKSIFVRNLLSKASVSVVDYIIVGCSISSHLWACVWIFKSEVIFLMHVVGCSSAPVRAISTTCKILTIHRCTVSAVYFLKLHIFQRRWLRRIISNGPGTETADSWWIFAKMFFNTTLHWH